jgi:hypothetical protein
MEGITMDEQIRLALQAALAAFRRLYERMEAGEDTDDLLADESLWPLTQLREALGEPF